MEREEEEGSSKKVIRKITYKGEVEIEAEKTEAIEVTGYPYIYFRRKPFGKLDRVYGLAESKACNWIQFCKWIQFVDFGLERLYSCGETLCSKASNWINGVFCFRNAELSSVPNPQISCPRFPKCSERFCCVCTCA